MRKSYEGKTHCANGHLLVDTLRTWTNQQGQVRRRCNRCVGESQVRLKERLKKSGEWSLRIKTNNLRRRFGLTLERFNELLRLQNYKCAACDEALNDQLVHVDHDHLCCPSRYKTCGKCIRGLLCSRCNNALGLVQDRLSVLINLGRYLERTRHARQDTSSQNTIELFPKPIT